MLNACRSQEECWVVENTLWGKTSSPEAARMGIDSITHAAPCAENSPAIDSTEANLNAGSPRAAKCQTDSARKTGAKNWREKLARKRIERRAC